MVIASLARSTSCGHIEILQSTTGTTLNAHISSPPAARSVWRSIFSNCYSRLRPDTGVTNGLNRNPRHHRVCYAKSNASNRCYQLCKICGGSRFPSWRCHRVHHSVCRAEGNTGKGLGQPVGRCGRRVQLTSFRWRHIGKVFGVRDLDRGLCSEPLLHWSCCLLQHPGVATEGTRLRT